MPRYKDTDASAGQGYFLPVNLRNQLLPGTFEHMLNEIIGTKIDISIFDKKYKNDLTGASAIPPVILLKLVIYGYSKGQNSSRKICKLNQENMVAKALTGDMDIHWTTIADFISSNGEEFKEIFVKVLMYCNELGLIGGETFATDGLRLPSNASLENSGTKAQLEKRLGVYRKMAEKHLTRHLKKDESGETVTEDEQKRFEKRQRHLNQQIAKLDNFISNMEDKKGKEGQALQSNVTDNESAMIHSSKGFIQGYIGIAVADEKNQVIVNAEAVGTANEGEHLAGLLDGTIKNLDESGFIPEKEKKQTALCDSNYFSEDNLLACEERGIEAIIPDVQEKRRKDADGNKKFDVNDFKYDVAGNKCVCPNGKTLEYKGTPTLRGKEYDKYQASATDCKACPLFSQCTWSEKAQIEITQGRKLLIAKNTEPDGCGSMCNQMREKMATEEYQAKYSRRIQIVEPVFANIRYCKGLDRFTLRGKKKVNGQWQLYCMVHNLGKCLNAYSEKKKCA